MTAADGVADNRPMDFEDHSPFGPVSPEEVARYEMKLGFQLPDDYKNYLIRSNGAVPLKRDYWMPNGKRDWIESIDEMSGIGPSDHPQSLLYYLEDPNGIPEGWIPIAHSGYGDFTVLSVRSEDYGKVFYLFHEVHGYDPSNRTDGVYELAASFSDWIDGLEDLPEEE